MEMGKTILESLIKDPRNINKLLYNKYGNITEEYLQLNLDCLIYSKNSHLFSVYKEYLIWDYIDEFLKRQYRLEEAIERLPKIANYYKNYLKYFCNPFFKDFKKNQIIQSFGDNKAEIYYKKNYGNKQPDKNNLANENINSLEDSSVEGKHKNMPTGDVLFNTTIRENINNNTLIERTNKEGKEGVGNFSDSFQTLEGLEQDSLLPLTSNLITRMSRGDSIVNIINNFAEDNLACMNKRINDRFVNKINKNNSSNNKKKTVMAITCGKYSSTVDKTDKTSNTKGIEEGSNSIKTTKGKDVITNNNYKRNKNPKIELEAGKICNPGANNDVLKNALSNQKYVKNYNANNQNLILNSLNGNTSNGSDSNNTLNDVTPSNNNPISHNNLKANLKNSKMVPTYRNQKIDNGNIQKQIISISSPKFKKISSINEFRQNKPIKPSVNPTPATTQRFSAANRSKVPTSNINNDPNLYSEKINYPIFAGKKTHSVNYSMDKKIAIKTSDEQNINNKISNVIKFNNLLNLNKSNPSWSTFNKPNLKYSKIAINKNKSQSNIKNEKSFNCYNPLRPSSCTDNDGKLFNLNNINNNKSNINLGNSSRTSRKIVPNNGIYNYYLNLSNKLTNVNTHHPNVNDFIFNSLRKSQSIERRKSQSIEKNSFKQVTNQSVQINNSKKNPIKENQTLFSIKKVSYDKNLSSSRRHTYGKSPDLSNEKDIPGVDDKVNQNINNIFNAMNEDDFSHKIKSKLQDFLINQEKNKNARHGKNLSLHTFKKSANMTQSSRFEAKSPSKYSLHNTINNNFNILSACRNTGASTEKKVIEHSKRSSPNTQKNTRPGNEKIERLNKLYSKIKKSSFGS